MIYTILNEERFYTNNIKHDNTELASKSTPRSIFIVPDRNQSSNPGSGRNFDKAPYFKYFNKENAKTNSDPCYRISLVYPTLISHYDGAQNWKTNKNEGEILMHILNSYSTSKAYSGKTVWEAMRQHCISFLNVNPILIPETPLNYINIFK